MDDGQVVLVCELLAGEDHRDADGGEQAGERELGPLLLLDDAVVVEQVVKPLVAKALDVVRRHVVDGLGTV